VAARGKPKGDGRREFCSETRLHPLLLMKQQLFVELDYSSPSDGTDRRSVVLLSAQIAAEVTTEERVGP
jgi:hypothetical protein